MGKAYDGKKRWNETIRQTTAVAASGTRRGKTAKAQARVSGRTLRLSKAMKAVDEETREIVRNARLDALEADNYGYDAEADQGEDGDEAYVDEDALGAPTSTAAVAATTPNSKAKMKADKKQLKRPGGDRKSAATRRWKVKSLAQLVFEEHGTGDASSHPTYLSIAAKPPAQPARKFCVVCGYFAAYSCRRCGSRFCRVQCGERHQESGCLKFGL